MFDLRIIIAVLITLWGVGMAMANDVIDIQDVQSFQLPDISQAKNIVPNQPFGNAKPTIPMTATLYANQSPQLDTRIGEPMESLKLTFATNAGSIYIRGSEVDFQNRIATLTAEGFQGSLAITDTVHIDGSAEELVVNNISFKDARISSDPVTAYTLRLKGIKRKNFEFKRAKGIINTTGGTWKNMQSTQQITIHAFSGDTQFNMRNQSYQFSGKIAKLTSADNQLLQIGT